MYIGTIVSHCMFYMDRYVLLRYRWASDWAALGSLTRSDAVRGPGQAMGQARLSSASLLAQNCAALVVLLCYTHAPPRTAFW